MAHIACLSDLHFGEPYSLLRNDLLIYAGKMVSYLAGGVIDELVLLGDIFELAAPEEPDAAFPAARTFFHALTGDRGHGIDLPHVIWVPGNHDHALWTHYVAATKVNPSPAGGWTLWENGDASDDTAQHLLSNLFGDAALACIDKVSVYNPLYVARLNKASFVFHHGHLFDDLVLGKSGMDEFKGRVMSLFAGSFAQPNAPERATDLADLEARTTAFVDGVWGRVTDRQTLKSQAWEFLTRFRRWSSCNTDGPPEHPQFAALGNLEQTADLPGEQENIRAFLQKFVFAKDPPPDPVSLVYGHFHRGGQFDLAVDPKRTVRCYNTGGWVTSHPGTVPHTHLLMIDADGNVDQRAIRFPPSVIAESIEHGESVRALDVPDATGGQDGPRDTESF